MIFNRVPSPGAESIFKAAADRVEALVHADEAETSPELRAHVEPCAVVDDAHREAGLTALQMDENLARAAMLERVLKRLLHDAIHAERDVLRAVGFGTFSCVNAIVTPGRASSC